MAAENAANGQLCQIEYAHNCTKLHILDANCEMWSLKMPEGKNALLESRQEEGAEEEEEKKKREKKQGLGIAVQHEMVLAGSKFLPHNLHLQHNLTTQLALNPLKTTFQCLVYKVVYLLMLPKSSI